MRIRVDFTIDIPRESLPALRDIAEVDSNQDAVMFVKGDAQQNILDYLYDNGVGGVTVIRDAVTTY